MYNGIGLQTARGSGTNGYIQTNKFFIKPKTNKLTSKSSYETSTGGQEGSGGRRPNKEILEHDRKREIELKLAVLEDKLIDQGYTDDEIAVKLHDVRNTLQSETVVVLNPHHNHHKYSDTQSHQVAARKEKQMEKLKNALGIKVHEDDAKKIDDDGDDKAGNTCKKTDGGFDDGKLEEKDTKAQYKKKTKKRRESSSSSSDSDSDSRRENVKVSNKKKQQKSSRGRSDTESSDSDVDDIRKNRKKLSSKHSSKSRRRHDTKKHVETVKRYHRSDSDGNSSSDGSLDIKRRHDSDNNDSDSDVDKYHRTTRQLEDKMRKEKRKVEKDISSTRNDYGRGGINDRWDGGSSSKRDVRGGTTHGKGRRHDDTDDEDNIHHKKEEVERRRHGRDSTEVIIDKRLKKERETVRNEEDSSDRKDIKSGETRHHIEDHRKTERDNVKRDGRRGEKRQREHKKERVEGPHDSDDDIDARRTKHNVFLRDAGRKRHREELDIKEIRTGGISGVEENEKGRVESDDDDIKHTRVDRGGNKQEDVLNYKNSTSKDEQRRHRSKTSSDDEDDKYLEEGRKEEDGRGRKHKRDEEDDEKKPEKGRKLRESKYSREHERRRGDRDRYADDSKRTRYDGGRSRH